MWGLGFPLLLIGALVIFGRFGALLLLIYPLQILRRMTQMRGSLGSRLQFSFFEQLSRFPEALGQLRFLRDRLLKRRGRLIAFTEDGGAVGRVVQRLA